MNAIETWQKVAEWTGVHIEYDLVDSANLSAKCEKLDVLCAYMDWWMSDWGGEWTSWGPT